MIDPRPQADRILVAQLTGEARHHARWRNLTGAEETAAVAALRELAGGRADLLAEVAGILEGAAESQPDEPIARQAAGLCRAAGADTEAIPAWAAEGRRRRANASKPPFSGGLHGGLKGGIRRWRTRAGHEAAQVRTSRAPSAMISSAVMTCPGGTSPITSAWRSPAPARRAVSSATAALIAAQVTAVSFLVSGISTPPSGR
jgi:hypothetical protein